MLRQRLRTLLSWTAIAGIGIFSGAFARHWVSNSPRSPGAPIERSTGDLLPELSSPSRTIDLAEVDPLTDLLAEFTLTNHGQNDFEVQDLHTDCGCISAEANRKTLAPNGQLKVSVKYRSPDESGPFHRRILLTLTSSAVAKQQILFELSGKVRLPSLVIFPASLDFAASNGSQKLYIRAHPRVLAQIPNCLSLDAEQNQVVLLRGESENGLEGKAVEVSLAPEIARRLNSPKTLEFVIEKPRPLSIKIPIQINGG
jgi:hypothetical protein